MQNTIITGTTGVLGLIGNPVRHTMSPMIHNTLSEELGQDLRYLPFPVEEDVTAAVRGAYHLGIRGLNVTVPHKTAVMEALAEVDDSARIIGAVNTLVRIEGGYKGYNTDMPGLGRALKLRGISLSGQQVIVLGAGGASRAVCTLALSEGADSVWLLNRTLEKAAALAEELNQHFEGERLTALAAEDYKKVPRMPSILIQCTSLGLHEGDGLLVEDDDFFHMATYGYDLIYNPAVTPFLANCERLGIPCDNGLSMLLYQGIIAYELWTGVSVSEELAKRVYTRLRRHLYGENVVLTGYMGCGKSTVGQALAEKTGKDFLDTDTAIEEMQGCSIREIFEEQGEEAFRDMETELLRHLSETCVNTVIATGGGIVGGAVCTAAAEAPRKASGRRSRLPAPQATSMPPAAGPSAIRVPSMTIRRASRSASPSSRQVPVPIWMPSPYSGARNGPTGRWQQAWSPRRATIPAYASV